MTHLRPECDRPHGLGLVVAEGGCRPKRGDEGDGELRGAERVVLLGQAVQRPRHDDRALSVLHRAVEHLDAGTEHRAGRVMAEQVLGHLPETV